VAYKKNVSTGIGGLGLFMLALFFFVCLVSSAHAADKEVEIRKHRNGPVGRVRLRYFDAFTRFDSLAQ